MIRHLPKSAVARFTAGLLTGLMLVGGPPLEALQGQVVLVPRASGMTVEHTYDIDGTRVKTVTTPAGGPPQVVEYLVDTSGGLSQVVLEGSSATTISAYYVRGDDLISVIRPQAEGPSVVREYHADGLGSIRALTDETGAVTDTWQFEAFGQVVAHVGSDPNAYLFAGEMLDPNTGWAYHRARWMDPRVGRFGAMDPWAGATTDPFSLHKYSYANLQPVSLTDPTGLYSTGEAVASFAVSAILSGIRGAFIGGVVVGIDSVLGGESFAEGFKTGFKFGAVFGALGAIRFLQAFLSLAGLGFGVWGTYQAILDDEWDQAVFRGLLTAAGAFLSWRAYETQRVRYMNPAELRWCQTTAGGGGRADAIRASMREHGWKGPPIDAVETVDGVVTLDHTRAAVALELGISRIPVRIHQPQDALPLGMLDRPFGGGSLGATARTWGEAVALRAFSQNPRLSPTGTPKAPLLRYKKN